MSGCMRPNNETSDITTKRSVTFVPAKRHGICHGDHVLWSIVNDRKNVKLFNLMARIAGTFPKPTQSEVTVGNMAVRWRQRSRRELPFETARKPSVCRNCEASKSEFLARTCLLTEKHYPTHYSSTRDMVS